MRTQTISIKHLNLYKKAILGFYIGGLSLVSFLLAYRAIDTATFSIITLQPLILILILWNWFKVIYSVKSIEYDSKAFYVKISDYEEIIPFENVVSVKLIALSGIYKIVLRQESQSGKEIYFKPSLLYPLDYKKTDKKIFQIQDLIKKYHQEYFVKGKENMEHNALGS